MGISGEMVRIWLSINNRTLVHNIATSSLIPDRLGALILQNHVCTLLSKALIRPYNLAFNSNISVFTVAQIWVSVLSKVVQTQGWIYSYNMAILDSALVNRAMVSSCLSTKHYKKSWGTAMNPGAVKVAVEERGLKDTLTDSELEVGAKVDVGGVPLPWVLISVPLSAPSSKNPYSYPHYHPIYR